jgi:hypothetical protein
LSKVRNQPCGDDLYREWSVGGEDLVSGDVRDLPVCGVDLIVIARERHRAQSTVVRKIRP